MRTPILVLALLSSLTVAAQVTPAMRRDSASFGLGFHQHGPMLTFMKTGSRSGVFLGLAARPFATMNLKGEPADGLDPVYTREEIGSREFHGGVAFRVNSQVVLGVGMGIAVREFSLVYHEGRSPYSRVFPDPAAAGPLSESRTGPLLMADIRLGYAWGLHMVGGTTGAGAALSLRF